MSMRAISFVMLCLMSLQENCTKILFSSTKKRYHLDLPIKTCLLPLQAHGEQRERAGMSPVKGQCHRRKHDTHSPGTHRLFLGRDEKGLFCPIAK